MEGSSIVLPKVDIAQAHPILLQYLPSAPSISTNQAQQYKGEGVAHFYTDYKHACKHTWMNKTSAASLAL